MTIGILKETLPEKRVALLPESIPGIVDLKVVVLIEKRSW